MTISRLRLRVSRTCSSDIACSCRTACNVRWRSQARPGRLHHLRDWRGNALVVRRPKRSPGTPSHLLEHRSSFVPMSKLWRWCSYCLAISVEEGAPRTYWDSGLTVGLAGFLICRVRDVAARLSSFSAYLFRLSSGFLLVMVGIIMRVIHHVVVQGLCQGTSNIRFVW